MFSSSEANRLIEQAHAAGCVVAVLADGNISIRPAKNLPPELRSEIARHRFSVLLHLYGEQYRGWWYLDKAPEVRKLLYEAREAGASVTVKTLDGETSDLDATDAVGAIVRPGKAGTPQSIISALEAAGFEYHAWPEHYIWANAWTEVVHDLVNTWRGSSQLAEQLAVWLAIDAADAVARRGLEPWDEVVKTYQGIEANLPQYGRARALRPVLRKWLEANGKRDALRAKGQWLEPVEGDYTGLVLSEAARPVQSECERWAWLVVITERLAGNWPWIDPSGWLELLGALHEVAA